MLKPTAASKFFAVAAAVALLGACGRVSPVMPGASNGAKAVIPAASDYYQDEPQPTTSEPDPNEGPINLPNVPKAPTTPVEPSSMRVRALATTLSNLPLGIGGKVNTQFQPTLIRARITWTPVKGASGYRVYQKENRPGDESKGKLIYALPQWIPVALAGGGYGLLNLKVGAEYAYTVEALDRSNNIIAVGTDAVTPIAPLAVPQLTGPGPNASRVGQTPFFSWTPVENADGYFCEVFRPVHPSVPGGVPAWRVFRTGDGAKNLQYGQHYDTYAGTRPLQWALPLNIGSRYSWTVCAVKTDTGNMSTAKAIAKATAPIAYFMP